MHLRHSLGDAVFVIWNYTHGWILGWKKCREVKIMSDTELSWLTYQKKCLRIRLYVLWFKTFFLIGVVGLFGNWSLVKDEQICGFENWSPSKVNQLTRTACDWIETLIPLYVLGIGIAMLTISCIVSVYYNVILSWVIYYLANSFNTTLPWTTCDNVWNTNHCVTGTYHMQNGTQSSIGNISDTGNYTSSNISENSSAQVTLAAEEYWRCVNGNIIWNPKEIISSWKRFYDSACYLY